MRRKVGFAETNCDPSQWMQLQPKGTRYGSFPWEMLTCLSCIEISIQPCSYGFGQIRTEEFKEIIRYVQNKNK